MNEVFTTGAEGVQMLAEFPGNWGAFISAEMKVGKLARICTMPGNSDTCHRGKRLQFPWKGASVKSTSGKGNAKLLILGLVNKNVFMLESTETWHYWEGLVKCISLVQGDSWLLVQVIIPLTSLYFDISPNPLNTWIPRHLGFVWCM